MAFYKTGCNWSISGLLISILLLATFLSRIASSPVVIPEEALCSLICPDGQQNCEACQRLIPMITSRPVNFKRLSRRSFCENQCRMGLRGSYGSGCGCGHDPTKRSNNMMQNDLPRPGAMNSMNLNCFSICHSGQTSSQCNCATIFRIQKAMAARNLMPESAVPEVPGSVPSDDSVISGLNCDALCSIGIGTDKCECAKWCVLGSHRCTRAPKGHIGHRSPKAVSGEPAAVPKCIVLQKLRYVTLCNKIISNWKMAYFW